MSFTTIPLSNQKLTAALFSALLTELRPTSVVKASPTSRNSTIAPTADPELFVTLSANATYEVRVVIIGSSAVNASGDLRLRLAWTNTATVTWWLSGLVDTLASGTSADLQAIAVASDATSPTADTQFGLSTTVTGQEMRAYVVVGSSASVLTLEWAQLASSPNNSSVLAGSMIIARRLG